MPGQQAPLIGAAMLQRALPRRSWGALHAGARLALVAAGGRGRGDAVDVRDNGRTKRLGRGPKVTQVTLHDPRAYGAFLQSGTVGLGVSYVTEWWDAEDLTAFLRLLLRRTRLLRGGLDRIGRAAAPVLDVFRRLAEPTRAHEHEHIEAHYDLSNEFFSLMLDDSMAYSCALFERSDMSLEAAQTAKMRRLCKKLDLRPEDHLLEIGSGWGGLALYAATQFGCRVTTTTISEAQHAYVEKRVADLGCADRVTVLDTNWRDLRGRFDKLVSVEMIEAVDWRCHKEFFALCSSLLPEDGLALLQAIVLEDASFERAKWHRDFIRRVVFPGSCIPSLASLTASLLRGSDMRVVDIEDIGAHYPQTLRHWGRNLEMHVEQLDSLGVPTDFRRLWAFYLAYCEAAFIERHISDVQIVLAKPAHPGLSRKSR